MVWRQGNKAVAEALEAEEGHSPAALEGEAQVTSCEHTIDLL